MTGMDERLAKVAEVLRRHEPGAFAPGDTACMCDGTWRTHAAHNAHVAQALAPLLVELQAEDEVALRRVRALAERGAPDMRGYPTLTGSSDRIQTISPRELRAALDGTQP